MVSEESFKFSISVEAQNNGNDVENCQHANCCEPKCDSLVTRIESWWKFLILNAESNNVEVGEEIDGNVNYVEGQTAVVNLSNGAQKNGDIDKLIDTSIHIYAAK